MTDKKSAALALLEKFSKNSLTFSCAESCTGGLIAKKITDVSGASGVFLGGVVSYACSVKERVLGVSAETIEKFGVVSEETALEMCKGVRTETCSDVSVSVTGVAGPSGGSGECPVGTVCFGLSAKGLGEVTCTCRFGETLSREEIREKAAEFALNLAVCFESVFSGDFFRTAEFIYGKENIYKN